MLPLHGEMYYQKTRPELLWFFCEIAPKKHGQTTICDAHALFNALSKKHQNLLLNNKLTYLRRYKKSQWQSTFQINEKEALEVYLRDNDFTFRWLKDDTIETQYVQAAILYNQQQQPLAINNIATVASHELLQSLLGREQTNTIRFENGKKIPKSLLLSLLYHGYKLSREHQWQKNDIILVDNKQFLHGRRSVKKDNRKINVRMADYL